MYGKQQPIYTGGQETIESASGLPLWFHGAHLLTHLYQEILRYIPLLSLLWSLKKCFSQGDFENMGCVGYFS